MPKGKKVWEIHRVKSKSDLPGGGGWLPMPKGPIGHYQKIPIKHKGIRTVKRTKMRSR